MTFFDCKKRFPWSFFSGGPGVLRVKVQHFVETGLLETEDTSTIREETRTMILEDLEKDQFVKT